MLRVSGPGCSSVGYGATQEIGPFIVDTKGHGLKYNPHSWNTGIYVRSHNLSLFYFLNTKTNFLTTKYDTSIYVSTLHNAPLYVINHKKLDFKRSLCP